jgi:hypothetical protein
MPDIPDSKQKSRNERSIHLPEIGIPDQDRTGFIGIDDRNESFPH